MVGLWYDSSIFCGITSHYHPIVGSGFSFPILCSFALHPGTPNIHTISSQYFDVSQLDNFSYNIYVHVRPSRIPKGEMRYLKKRWTQSLILELLIGWISLKLFCHCFIILKLLLYLEISLLIDETFCVTIHSCAPTFELKMTKCNG